MASVIDDVIRYGILYMVHCIYYTLYGILYTTGDQSNDSIRYFLTDILWQIAPTIISPSLILNV